VPEATASTRPKTPQVLKIFLSVFIPLAVILTIFQFIFFRAEWENYRLNLETTEHVYMDSNMSLIAGELGLILSDLTFLSEMISFHLFSDKHEEILSEVNEEFLILSREKRLYDQVRFLDTDGQEMVRVNFNGGNPGLVLESELQNKADRYYFRETVNLKRGQIYVSPFDLNMEAGQIEQPLKPVVRFATPVIDKQGRGCGIVILNYLGDHILDKISRVQHHQLEAGRIVSGQDHVVDVFLLNRDGYWLFGSDPGDLWGFMYEDRRDRTFGNIYPEAWKIISSTEEGNFVTANGLFTFGTVYPELGKHSSFPEFIPGSGEGSAVPTSPAPATGWTVVTRVPQKELKAMERELLNRMSMLYLVILAVMAAVSWLVARAVGAQKLANRLAEESQIKFRQLFDAAVDAIFIVNPQTHRFLEVNQAAVDRLGYSREELLQMTFEDIDSPESETDVDDVIRQLPETGLALFEQIHRSKDGTDIPVEISTRLVQFEDHDVMQTIARDITERKESEAALRQSENKFHQIFKHSPEAIVLLDQQGTVLDLNERIFDWLGYRPEEVAGKNFMDLPFLPDESKARAKEELAGRMRGEPAVPYELDFISKEGELRVGLIHPVLLEDDSGSVTRDLVMIADITDRKHAEKVQDMLIRDISERMKELNILYEITKLSAGAGLPIEDILQRVIDLIPPAWHYPEITCGRIIAQGETYTTANFEDTEWKQSAEITINGEPDGSIEICYLEDKPELYEGPFIKEERDLLDTVARLLGTIIERKQAEEAIKEYRDHLEELVRDRTEELEKAHTGLKRDFQVRSLLYELQMVSLEDISLKDMLEKHLDCLLSIPWLPTISKGAVFLVEDEPGILSLAAQRNFPKGLLKKHKDGLPFGTCLCGTAAEKGEIVFAEKLDERHIIRYRGIKPHGQYSVPIISADEKVIGVYTLHLEERHQQTELEIQMLEAVAHVMAGAIERKRAEQQSRKLSRVIESTTEAVALIDLGRTDTLTYVNPAWEKMFGYSGKDVVGKKEGLIVEASQRDPALRERFVEAIKTGSTFQIEMEWQRKDGSFIPVDVITVPIRSADGGIVTWVNTIRDITERKCAEQALQKAHDELEQRVEERTAELKKKSLDLQTSEHRIRSLLESMSSGVAVYRVENEGDDFILLDFNKAAERIENISRDKIIGKNVIDVFPAVEEFGLLDVFKRVYITGAAEHYPVSFYRDGRIAGWRENYVYKLPGGEIVAVYDDVTERMQAEEALQESREKYQRLVDDIGDQFIMFSHNPDGEFTFVSDGIVPILGVSKEDAHSKPWQTLAAWLPEDAAEAQANDELLFSGKADYCQYDLRFIHPDGGERTLHISQHAVRNEDGKIIAIEGIAENITRRKQAEKELQSRAAFVLNNPAPVLQADLEGNIVLYNPHCCEIFGRDIDGEALPGLFPGIPKETFSRIKPDKPGRFEVRLGEQDFLFTVVKSPETGSLYLYGADITTRKKFEESTIAAKLEAEAASRSKSDFLSSMSHELRTPLNAIIGFSEVLKEQYFGDLNEKQSEYVGDVLTSARHLLSLINDILDLSKVEAGKMELEPGPVGLKGLLQGSLVMIKEKAHKHGVKLDLAVPEDMDELVITADERKLKQVMFNLLSNAAKFTPQGGSITVAAESTKEVVTVSVTDTGIGLSPEDRERVFETFYQARGGLTDKTPGTGLGLPLSRKFIELHGGRLWAESDGEGKGSRFIFTIPVSGE